MGPHCITAVHTYHNTRERVYHTGGSKRSCVGTYLLLDSVPQRLIDDRLMRTFYSDPLFFRLWYALPCFVRNASIFALDEVTYVDLIA